MARERFNPASAPGLHSNQGMRMRIVGFVAVVLLAGCGVGADASYPELGADHSSQALEQTASSEQPKPETQPPETTAPVPTRDPGTVALPQDPIPVYVGQPTPQPAGGMTTVDPDLGRGPSPKLPPLPAPLPLLPPL
jgi:hypothetical protein